MTKTAISLNGTSIPVILLDTAVVGSGCAGFNAADWLYDLGRENVAILTEGVKMGTSRNTGSDKQTYYKLSLAGGEPDSVGSMAEDLFAGGGVNGDTALAEAAGSVQSFIRLVNLGVPFPNNEYGEFAGYQTDHDSRRRATSAGPLTSKYMTEYLERSAESKGIPVLDGMTAIRILTSDGRAEGLLCLDRSALGSPCRGLTVVRARQVILATGGPAGCYFHSVYPESQTGMSGMALEAGAKGANLQEWQYGLASARFRWNVSGTYQQALPRYISVDQNGVEREFLPDTFGSAAQALNMEFLKGYQWPFDVEKLQSSSKIDLIVSHETLDLGRRVYLDFRTDPAGLEKGFDVLGGEALEYLERSRALVRTPIARLERMNPAAVALYREHGIDLYREPLEIHVCAQHHNGGIAVDGDWQTCVRGLYAAGEAAGTFGARRPGGSALNSTQVGSLRAAHHIAGQTEEGCGFPPEFEKLAEEEAARMLARLEAAVRSAGPGSTVRAERVEMQKKMSACAAHLRDAEKMSELETELKRKLAHFEEEAHISGARELPALMKNRDIFLTQLAVLSAMQEAARDFGSRGSALVLRGGEGSAEHGPAGISFAPSRLLRENLLVTTEIGADGFRSTLGPVRPLPRPDNWFETVWSEYRRRTGRENWV